MIFNELKYAEEMLEKGFLQTKYLLELKILSKYLNNIEGLTKTKIKNRIKEFCSNHWEKYNEVQCLSTMQKAVSYGVNKKNQLFIASKISVTKSELDFIISLADVKLEKLAFSFLVLSKVNKNRSEFYADVKNNIELKQSERKEKKLGVKIEVFQKLVDDKYYINNLTESFNYAKVNVKKSVLADCIKILSDKKLIKLTMVGSVEVLFISEDSNEDVALSFDISNDFIFEYLKYIGLYKGCEKCGIPISPTNNKNKYCADCAKEIKMEMDRERMKEVRNSRK